jgi:exonuclease III
VNLLSWNVAHRRCCEAQVRAISDRAPDAIALQEVTERTVRNLEPLLQDRFPFLLHSCGREHLPDDSLARHYGELIASRWPLTSLPAEDCGLPWAERLLSVVIDTPFGEVELHTAYIPPGSSHGWLKVETLEGIYRRLARPSERPRILCGDFNTPQAEHADGRVITWAESVGTEDAITLDGSHGERWDKAERDVLTGLQQHDLRDTFRALHGYSEQEFSWFITRNGRTTGRRFDHVFASHSLIPRHAVTYIPSANKVSAITRRLRLASRFETINDPKPKKRFSPHLAEKECRKIPAYAGKSGRSPSPAVGAGRTRVGSRGRGT